MSSVCVCMNIQTRIHKRKIEWKHRQRVSVCVIYLLLFDEITVCNKCDLNE